jgi:hypothetical protein
MMLIDVLRHLNTEHELRFLLAAYLENLQSRHVENQLPLGVAALPLKGTQDIEARFAELLGAALCGLARGQCDTQTAIAREATEIFGAAVKRLHTLREGDAAAPIPHFSSNEFSQVSIKQEYLAASHQAFLL